MLNLDEIIAAAREQTGLQDIGEPDITEGLEVLIDSLNREANLRPDGVEAERAALTGLIVNRLRINDAFTRNPEILDEKIRGPIVIVGLPRSGTTKLHRMLGAHPGIQFLPLYKLLIPVPLGPAPPGGEDPRIAVAEQVSTGMRDHHPEFFAGHPMIPREADEEVWMLDLVTRGPMPTFIGHVPSYMAWAQQQEMGSWYDYLCRLLQMFQFHDGTSDKTWLIKAPEHMGMLDLLLDRFPDATVVCTHRDPVTAIASIAVLGAASRRMYTDHDEPEEMGRFSLEHWSRKLRRLVEEREQLGGSHRFVDAPYRDIVGDIMGVIEQICAAAGVDVDDTARVAMRAWEADNPQHKHGRHSYALEEVGLTEAQVRGEFTTYLERYAHLL